MTTTQIHLAFKEEASRGDGYLLQLQINADDGEQIMLLETKDWDGVPIRQQWRNGKDNLLIINKNKYPFTGFTEWAGNVFWNAYKMQKADALRLVNDLAKSGDWSASEAWEVHYEKFNTQKEIVAADLEWDAAVEQSSYNENQMSLF